jgi:hypothetical protein
LADFPHFPVSFQKTGKTRDVGLPNKTVGVFNPHETSAKAIKPLQINDRIRAPIRAGSERNRTECESNRTYPTEVRPEI